jgi:hypothetical protein
MLKALNNKTITWSKNLGKNQKKSQKEKNVEQLLGPKTCNS